MNISLREFQRQASMYIKSLDKEDIVLTQYNIPIARVVSVDIKSTEKINEPLTVEDSLKVDSHFNVAKELKEEKPWTQVTRCEYQTCRKDAIGNFSIETYSTDTGDQTITKNLCKLHKYHATKEGKVTQI